MLSCVILWVFLMCVYSYFLKDAAQVMRGKRHVCVRLQQTKVAKSPYCWPNDWRDQRLPRPSPCLSWRRWAAAPKWIESGNVIYNQFPHFSARLAGGRSHRSPRNPIGRVVFEGPAALESSGEGGGVQNLRPSPPKPLFIWLYLFYFPYLWLFLFSYVEV